VHINLIDGQCDEKKHNYAGMLWNYTRIPATTGMRRAFGLQNPVAVAMS
jgi:hypothetical protein